MSISIIRADASHAANIAGIGKYSFKKAFEHLFNSREELLEYLEYTYDPIKIARSIRKGNNLYLLAMLDGRPVGFAKLKLHSLNEHIESGAQMELQKLYVEFEQHGLGIGAALMNEVIRLSRDKDPDFLWLDVHVSNEKAIRFYERNGFRKLGRHYFNIGTQTFHFHIMGLPVAEPAFAIK